jgi:hypothetical protein
MPLSYATDIRSLFRDKDISAMKRYGNFDLSKYQDVVDHADDINSRLKAGDMPCDGAWSESDIQTFGRWIDDGKRP